jgi:sugar/nucleoside kinase (ribokinase family)
MRNTGKSYTIAGVGSPVVDQVAQVPFSFLESVHGEKGGMELVDEESFAILLASLPNPPISSPGGSAGNTTFALARLGMPSRFIGVLGDDVAGKYYLDTFAMLGGDISRFQTRKTLPTAQCLSLVTPDGERTMRTHLGAASSLSVEEISADDFNGCNHVHIEGYLLFNQELMEHVLKAAKKAGCSTSVDLASFEVVHAAGQKLPELLHKYVDVVFANEEEAEAFAGTADPEKCLDELGRCCSLSAIKYGAQGAIIRQGREIYKVAALPVSDLIDTTGAGDMWAAGFLYGLGTVKDLKQCGRYGSILGAAVVQHQGTALPEAEWSRILKQIRS